MGLLADIFSTADTAKRRLSGLLSDPMGTLALGVTRFGEDQGGLLNMTQNAYPMAGNKTVLNSPQQIANFRQQVADKGAEMAMQAATVWHGSPHKFDKFDSSKIGTGEGAQAYGHGLYLAESPEVAKSYQNANTFRAFDIAPEAEKRGLQLSAGARGEMIRQAQANSDPMIAARRLQYANSSTREIPQEKLADLIKGYQEAQSGALYKVDLPDEHIAKMLDWDAPLSKQPENVQSFAKKALEKEISNAGKVADGWGDLSAPYNALNELTGQDLISKLRPNLNASLQNITGGGGPEVSNALRQAGIPGIRYLDAMSREGGGTSNFVIFPQNEGLLKILERNGVPIK